MPAQQGPGRWSAPRASGRILAAMMGLLIATVLVARPITAYAAAGFRIDVTCCCPSLDDCRCPHGDGGNAAPMMRRCGPSGTMVAPTAQAAFTVPVVLAPAPHQVALPAPTHVLPAPLPAPTIEIETPPF